MWEKLKQLARRYDEIGELLEVPEIYADPKKLRCLLHGFQVKRLGYNTGVRTGK